MSWVSVQPGVLGQQAVLTRSVHRQRRTVLRYNLAAGLFLFVVLAVQLCTRLLVTQKGYVLERTREQALQRDNTLRRLHLELAYVSRPAGAARAAEERLGLAPLVPQRMRKLLIDDPESE